MMRITIIPGWLDIENKVSQSTVLKPALFLIFVNDLLGGTQCNSKLFAEDAMIYRRLKT